MCAAVTDAGAARRRERAARLRGLYVLTPDIDDTLALVAKVDAVLEGGAHVLQYRHKRADSGLREAQAQALVERCRAHGALFIVNDDAVLAAKVGADGVHLGEGDIDIASARRVVGDGALIGASCYNDLSRAREMVAAGADYVAFGSLFDSTVKPEARKAPLRLLGEARTLGVPVVGIGGIDAGNAWSAIAAGADAVALITAVFGPVDPRAVKKAAATLVQAIDAATATRAGAAAS
jgi:thiamine-phosphate pyrophosphorylase